MQDEAETPEEDEPTIIFTVSEDAQPDPAARRRLLEILFGPRADSDAA